jgi:hypothetical protein
MNITLRGTAAEIVSVPDELLIIRLTGSGAVAVLELANVRVAAEPYGGLVRLDADLINRTDNGEGGHRDE